MEKERKRTYVRPECTCTVVGLEGSICNGSSKIEVGTEDGAHGIEDQKVNIGFEDDNNFSTNGAGWDIK